MRILERAVYCRTKQDVREAWQALTGALVVLGFAAASAAWFELVFGP